MGGGPARSERRTCASAVAPRSEPTATTGSVAGSALAPGHGPRLEVRDERVLRIAVAADVVPVRGRRALLHRGIGPHRVRMGPQEVANGDVSPRPPRPDLERVHMVRAIVATQLVVPPARDAVLAARHVAQPRERRRARGVVQIRDPWHLQQDVDDRLRREPGTDVLPM